MLESAVKNAVYYLNIMENPRDISLSSEKYIGALCSIPLKMKNFSGTVPLHIEACVHDVDYKSTKSAILLAIYHGYIEKRKKGDALLKELSKILKIEHYESQLQGIEKKNPGFIELLREAGRKGKKARKRAI